MWLKKYFDKTERIMLYAVVGTLIGDILSTIFFSLLGQANKEANLLIVTLGWWVGGAISLVLNLLLIVGVVYFLKKYRAKYNERFYLISFLVNFCILRTLVIVSNIYLGINQILLTSKCLTSIPPSVPLRGLVESSIINIVLALAIIIPWGITLLVWKIYTLNYKVEYKGDKQWKEK